MKYRNIKETDILTEVWIKVCHADVTKRTNVHEFLDMTPAGIRNEFIMPTTISLVDKLYQNNPNSEILLSFNHGDEEVTITLSNTTSDKDSEWFKANTVSDIFKDSVLLGYDIYPEVNDRYLCNNKGTTSVEEYYEKYYASDLLKEALVERFIFDDLSYYDYGFNTPISSEFEKVQVMQSMSGIPVQNLRNLLSNYDKLLSDCGTNKVTDVFIEMASKEGLLNFEPYISVDNAGEYSLVLEYNRFVHLFRGLYYQCSCTESGIGEYTRSGIMLNEIDRVFEKYCLNGSKLHKYMYYINLINCCKGLDSFDNLLETDPMLVDRFMKLSTQKVFKDYDIKYREDIVQDMVTYINPKDIIKSQQALGAPRKTYRVPWDEVTDCARVKVYEDNFVGIEFYEDYSVQEWLFTLPNVIDESTDVHRLAVEWDMLDDMFVSMAAHDIYDNFEVQCSLVSFALNYSGFVTNFGVTYPTKARLSSKLMSLCMPGVPEFKNLNTLYKSDRPIKEPKSKEIDWASREAEDIE